MEPFGTHGDQVPTVFQGTLVEEKSDYSGLGYMRNRYYDPQSPPSPRRTRSAWRGD